MVNDIIWSQFLFLLVQRDVLLSRQTKSAPTTPPSPYNSHSTTDDDKLQRQRVREELVNTEKDFYQEMSAFCTKVLPAFKQVIVSFVLL